MKFIVGLLFVTFSIAANGQSLFFNYVKDSQWTSEYFIDSVTFLNDKIGLSKLPETISATSSFYIWTFKNKLEISHYDPISKKDSLICLLSYEIVQEKITNYLRIYPFNTKQDYMEYEVGIVSTGNFVLLIKRKKK